ncbi:hypothetical protein M758_1G284400 [Ceratodon purpureus]|nr:hypothetical protein M758_1G284400 [Ceratodon purpureus]
MLCITPHIDDDDGALTLALSLSQRTSLLPRKRVCAARSCGAETDDSSKDFTFTFTFFLPALILAWLKFTFLPGPRSSFSSFSFSCVITHQPVSSIDRSTHTHTLSINPIWLSLSHRVKSLTADCMKYMS